LSFIFSAVIKFNGNHHYLPFFYIHFIVTFSLAIFSQLLSSNSSSAKVKCGQGLSDETDPPATLGLPHMV